MTAVAGAIAKKYGASFGGLFLAFPAIFPASATLIEKHERARKQDEGKSGIKRARKAVAADAAGAAIGTLGLIAFAFYTWKMLPQHAAWQTLLCATGIWLATSIVLWYARKRHVIRSPFRGMFRVSSPPTTLTRDQTEIGYKSNKAIRGTRNLRG